MSESAGRPIERWEVNVDVAPDGKLVGLRHRRSQTGQWVTFVDHQRELADCRAELERGRDVQIQAETLAQLLGAAILRLKELGDKSWKLPPYASRLASHAEREGNGKQAVGNLFDLMDAVRREGHELSNADIVSKYGIAPLAPSPAGPDALAEEIHALAVNAVCPIRQEPTTVFEINMVKILEEFGRSVAALRSRPAQGDAIYTKADMEAACEIVRAANRKVEKIRLGKMVDRFLAWRLPEDFSPDAGISFKPNFNEHTAYPMKHEPIGTNLFTAEQAEKMLRHVLEWDAAPDAAMSQQEKRDG